MPASGRLNILLVTRNFPPLTGGMERLMQKAAEGIARYADLTVVGPAGCSSHAPPGVEVHEVPSGLAPFLLQGSLVTLRLCRRHEFDIVIGGSGLAAPLLGIASSLARQPTCLFIHGLDIVVGNAVYQRLFLPFIRRAGLIIANSRNTRQLASDRGVPEERITIINPGTELPDITAIESRESFCHRHEIPFGKIILFTGRISRRKGLSGFIRHSLPAVLAQGDDIGLLVVGENPDHSLNQSGEGSDVRALVRDMNLGGRIKFLGQVGDDDLLAAYAAADVQIFPLVEVPGDVEGFGMVAIEAAALGTPTVAFDQGGVADAIAADGSCGQLVPPGDYPALATAVARFLQDPPDALCQPCIDHAARFHWDRFDAALEAAIRKQLSQE